MNLAEWCLKNNRTTWVLLTLVVLLGLLSYFTIPRQEDPHFTIRAATVTTVFPGASPRKVEQLVTDKLEKKIREMAEVDFVTSQSMTGLSVITIQMREDLKNMQPVWQKLRNKVADVAPRLPQGCRQPVVNDEFGDVFGIVVAITGDGFSYREMKDVADDVRDELLKLKDVGKVEIYGEQAERIFVEFSNARGAEHGFGPAALAEALRSQNIVQPGGNALVGPERVVLEPSGEFKSVRQIKKVSLRPPGSNQSLYLEDVAQVRRGFVDPPRVLTRFNGRPALILAVNMAEGGKITELGPRVRRRLKELLADLPVGIDFGVVAYQPKFVDQAIRNFMINLVEAFAFVFVVVLFFTGARTGLVVGALVPMAMLLCMILLPLFDVNLQRISIASLIIALGMLVDNGVVVSEEILVRISRGQDRFRACVEAARGLAKPMLAASLTTIFAFMPIATAQSKVGEYCFSLFVVITITLLSSWLLALTMVPLMSYSLLKPVHKVQRYDGRIYRAYRAVLLFNLRHRWLHLAAAVALLAVSLWAFKFVPNIFFPPNDREMFYIDFYQPYGTDIRFTAARAGRLERFLLRQKGVTSVGSFVGNGGPRWILNLEMRDQGPHYARLVVNTRTIEDMERLVRVTRRYLAANFPDLRANVRKIENGPPVGSPIQIRISGPDILTLYALRDRVRKAIAGVPGLVNLHDDWGAWTKKLVIQINQEKAKRAGFTSRDIALSLQTQISGMPVTEFREGKELIPIVIRAQQAYRQDLGKLEGLNVYSWRTGRSLPLSQLARPELTFQPSNIRRRDAVRTLTILGEVRGRFASQVMNDIRPILARLSAAPDWPLGYRINYGGEWEESAKSQSSIMAGVPLAMGLIVLLLVWQFNSLGRPLIIVLTIPPMMVGITFGLLATNAPFGFMAMLGLISLTGIIINNAIIMIDQIEKERSRGRRSTDAVVLAAHKRLRPIVMTATTTIVGLIPLALQGGEMWRPMANTLIFGLAFATALTLVLCPVLYSLFYRVPFKGYRWRPELVQGDED